MRRVSSIAFLLCASLCFGTTTIRLHAPISTVSGYQTMSLALGPVGAAVTTSITNTTASGTSIQATQTGGGTALAWMSEPFSGSATLNGTETLNFYGKEAAAANNASVQFQLFKYSGGSLGSAFCTGTWGTELTTSIATHAPTCAASSTAFSAGDQLVIKLFIVNCATTGCPSGTMGAGTPGVTIDYDGPTASADGDTNLALAETVTFDPYGGSGGTPSIVQTVIHHDWIYSMQAVNSGSGILSGDTLWEEFSPGLPSGNTIFVWTGIDHTTSLPTITDEKLNSYSLAADCVDSTNGEDLIVWVASNVAADTRKVTMTYHANAPNSGPFDMMMVKGVATAAPLDGSSCHFTTGTSVTAGSVTPHYSGDFVTQLAWNDTVNLAAGSGLNIHYTAGSQSNITWAKWDDGYAWAAGAQAGVYSSTSALNPTMTTSTGGYVSLSVFLRSAAAGSDVSGMHVNAIVDVPNGTSSPFNLTTITTYVPCPSADNLMVAHYPTGFKDLNSITDSHSNSWTQLHARVCDGGNNSCVHNYSADNATVSPDQHLTLTFSAAAEDTTMIYCITGAATSPRDTSAQQIASGNQTVAGNLTLFTVTPTTSNGIVLVDSSQGENTTVGFTDSSLGYVGCFESGESLNLGGCTANNGYGVYNNPNTSGKTWTSTMQSGVTAAQFWAAEADVFKGPSAVTVVPRRR